MKRGRNVRIFRDFRPKKIAKKPKPKSKPKPEKKEEPPKPKPKPVGGGGTESDDEDQFDELLAQQDLDPNPTPNFNATNNGPSKYVGGKTFFSRNFRFVC